jgi:hypothetical protein
MNGKPIELHPHARERANERGATESEVIATVLAGQRSPARLGRSAFRRNFPFGGMWRGKQYATKQIDAIAVEEDLRWLVITVLVKYS